MSQRFPAQVRLEDVSRIYGRSFALHRISMELTAGAITAVVGDNGAGKSTLLNIISTIDHPTSGEITYGEMSRRNFARQARHRIGWVSHDALLYDELTARENLAFFARMYGIDDRIRRVASWLDRVGLSAEADRRVRTFSRGMKQRLTLARALLHNPQIVLLDEPTTGLDQQGNRFVVDLLDQLRSRGRLLVLVTHDFPLVDRLADRIVILRRGKVTLDHVVDPSTELMEMYRSRA